MRVQPDPLREALEHIGRLAALPDDFPHHHPPLYAFEVIGEIVRAALALNPEPLTVPEPSPTPSLSRVRRWFRLKGNAQ